MEMCRSSSKYEFGQGSMIFEIVIPLKFNKKEVIVSFHSLSPPTT
jgi:hypothetical protein